MAMALPSEINDTCAGSAAVELKGLVELASGCNIPSASSVKPDTFPVPPAFRTYTRWSYTVMLFGVTPPEAIVDFHWSIPPETAKEEIELLLAFTAKRRSPDSTTAPWLPSPPPVPAPPVE